jgi:nucleoside-diphosphate-sugar epimerase
MMQSICQRPKVAISAASSFTGSWIARAFHEAGWTVLPVCSQPLAAYRGVRLARIQLVQQYVPVHFGCEAAAGRLAAWIRQHQPQIWIQHHHFMESFRSLDYDLQQALSIGLDSLPGILDAVASGGGVGVIYSGTYFEQGEGGQVWQKTAPTPYARSKSMIWDALCRGCESRGLRPGKIVIPNPVGPLENDDRLIPCMIRHAEARTALQLRAPGQLVDHVPIDDLATDYIHLATQLLTNSEQSIVRPSGRISTTLDWVQFAGRELLEKRLDLPRCRLEYVPLPARAREDFQDSGSPVLEIASINWTKLWDSYAAHLRRTRAEPVRWAA